MDKAGWPNGRRPNDDVTDIAVRVVGGASYVAARVGDGVNFLAGAPGAGLPQGPGNLMGTNSRASNTQVCGFQPICPANARQRPSARMPFA